MARKPIRELPRKVRVQSKPEQPRRVAVDISKDPRPKARPESGRDLIERGLGSGSLL